MPSISSLFARSVRPPLSRWSQASTNGVSAPPRMPPASASASARAISGSTSSRLSSGGRPRSRPPPPSFQCARAMPRRLVGGLDSRGDRRPSPRCVEEGQLVGSPAENGNAERLEKLRGGRHVEQGLHPRRDDENGCPSERVQIGRDIGRCRPASMDAAQTAGRHDRDRRGPAGGERPAHGCRAQRSLHDRGGEVARAELPRGEVEAGELNRREPHDELAVEDTDRRRYRAAGADCLFRREPDLDALAGRKPVRDERRLERDDAGPGRQGLAHLRGDPDHGIDPSFAQQRAAASRPSSTPPTRKPAANASPAPVGSTSSVGRAACSTPSTLTPRAPRLIAQAASSPPKASRSRSVANTEVGGRGADPRDKRLVDQAP